MNRAERYRRKAWKKEQRRRKTPPQEMFPRAPLGPAMCIGTRPDGTPRVARYGGSPEYQAAAAENDRMLYARMAEKHGPQDSYSDYEMEVALDELQAEGVLLDLPDE